MWKFRFVSVRPIDPCPSDFRRKKNHSRGQVRNPIEIEKQKEREVETFLQVSNYVTTWNQTVQHKFLIFFIDCWGLLFFLFSLAFSSSFASPHSTDSISLLPEPLPYHITLCLRNKSKTQNMGQTDIPRFCGERKWDFVTQAETQEESWKWFCEGVTCCGRKKCLISRFRSFCRHEKIWKVKNFGFPESLRLTYLVVESTNAVSFWSFRWWVTATCRDLLQLLLLWDVFHPRWGDLGDVQKVNTIFLVEKKLERGFQKFEI